MSATLTERIAGAPISWGVCEVPGWGPMLEPEVVLADMSELGLTATELGPAGYLPADPVELASCLGRYGLHPVAAFLPVVLDPGLRPEALRRALASARALAAAGGELLLVAPVADERWSRSGIAGEREAVALRDSLELLSLAIAETGARMALHPHAGTLVEAAADIELVEAAAIDWCLDTGHLMIGGVDPVEFARRFGDRVAHVHLKDVDARLAADVRAGRRTLVAATRAGLFLPLGRGDLDAGAVVTELCACGYSGWLTLEQDTVLDDPDPASARADVGRSIEFIRALEERR